MEQRRVATSPTSGGSRTSGSGTAEGEVGSPGKKRGRRKLLMVLLVTSALLGGGWYFFLREPAPEPPPEPGAVLVLEPVSINLADQRYLKAALALQLVLNAEEEPDPAKAQDLAVTHLTGRTVEELSDPAQREGLQQELTDAIVEAYHEEVLDVYFTEFVTQ